MSFQSPSALRFSISAAALIAASAAEAQQPIPLPGIVIEGATLERPSVVKQSPVSAQADDTAPAAEAKQQANTADGTALAAQASAAISATSNGNSAIAASGIAATEIGSAVTVVTATEILQQQARTSADVLRALPGVTVTGYGTPGSFTQVRIRGADGRDTRVLIDGVEVNTTKDAEFDFSNLSPDDIARIEVIRGPMSALYGSGATGGVVNIETKATKGPLALSFRSEAGSFGTRDLAARLSAGNESGFFALTGQDRWSKGFVVAPAGTISEDTRLRSFGLRAGLTLAPTAKLDTTLRYTDKHAALTGFGDADPSPAKLYQTADDSNTRLIERSVLAGVRLSWDQLGGALTQQLRSNYTNDVSGNDINPIFGYAAGTHSTSRDESARLNFAYAATYRLPTSPEFGRHAITGQVEKQSEKFTPFADGPFFGGFGGDGQSHQRNQLSAAGEWRGTFAERLALTAGARRDVNDTFESFNTWRTSASFDGKEWGLRPHASLGTGVKLPGMYDQFGANAANYESNPNLRAETSRGYDAGVEKRLLGDRLLADITYFRSDLRDKISLNGFDLATFKSFPINDIGISTRRGVEFAAKFQVTPTLFLGAAYTYTDARRPDGTPEYRRVPHGLRLDTRYQFDDGKGSFSVSAINNSRAPDIAFLNDGSFKSVTVDLAPYWLVQVAASYKVQPNIELYARVENALNARYQEVYGYNTASLGAYAGVKVQFDDILGSGKK